MPLVRVFSAAEQVAAQVSEEIMSGYWRGEMPGVYQLAEEMGVNHKTVDAALKLVEVSGLLVSQGPGRRRLVVLPEHRITKPALRVAILLGVESDSKVNYIAELKHELAEAGHVSFVPTKTMTELGMDTKRIAKLVETTEAHAWVVLSGSREVLAWFLWRKIPAFAMFGRRRDLPIAGAGPDKVRAFRDVVRHLVSLGHRRIVLLVLKSRRFPEPGLPERAFLDELTAHGITTGAYHLPDWDESPEGMQRLLNSLFQTTPPTALLIDEAYLFHAVKHHLSQQGIRVPGDVSLICSDPDETFAWCRPSIAHIRWDIGPIVRRIVRWANHVAAGEEDLRQTPTYAEYVPGGTVGEVKK